MLNPTSQKKPSSPLLSSAKSLTIGLPLISTPSGPIATKVWWVSVTFREPPQNPVVPPQPLPLAHLLPRNHGTMRESKHETNWKRMEWLSDATMELPKHIVVEDTTERSDERSHGRHYIVDAELALYLHFQLGNLLAAMLS
jgi:hypothetical protein